jgi:hypothetical protein
VWLLLHFTTVTAPYTSCDNFLSQSPFKPELAKRGITTYDKTSKNAREVADLCLSQDILGTTKNRAIKMNDNTTATAASGISQAHDLNPYSDIHTLLDAFHIISPRVGGS